MGDEDKVKGQKSDGDELFEVRFRITDVEPAEEQPEQAQGLFATLFLSAPTGIYVAQEGKFELVNPQFQKLTGYSEEELLHMACLGLVLPEDRNTVRRKAAKMLAGELSVPYEYSLVTKAGGIRRVMETVNSFIYRGKRGVLGNVVDVTAHEYPPVAAQREEWYRKLLEAANDPILVADAETQEVVACNEQAKELLGLPAEKILGMAQCDLPPLAETTNWKKMFGDVVRAGKLLVKDQVVQRSDGRKIWADVSASACEVGSRRLLLEVFHDDTERRKTEAALKALNESLEQRVAERTKELQRSNEDLAQFAYVASHDLQEPLRAVASYVQLLARRYTGRLDRDAHEFIGYAVEGAQRMQGMINGLLTYSQVGRAGKDFKPADCATVLAHTLANLQAAITESGAMVTADPLPTVLGDERLLMQLFQNLVSNAIKFRAKAPPRVHIAATLKDQEWVFAVQDNGIGIAPEFFDRLFVIFQRLHSKSEYPGTGIGLAICKKIVERHGGRMWVESEPQKGSKFCFTIPAKARAQA